MISDWFRGALRNGKKRKTFIQVIKWIVKDRKYILSLDEEYNSLLKELVDKDIWFYDAKQAKITANSKSIRIAFKRLLKELEK